MPLLVKRRAILAKIETTYGTDSTPASATDGVLCASIDVSPLEVETVDRELVRAFMGAFEQLITGKMVKLTIGLEIAGFGTAGPAAPTPGYDALLRACGLARTVTAGTKVDYNPISSGLESATIYFYQDGTLHKAVGCRGTPSLAITRDKIPLYTLEMMGVYAPVVDAALTPPVLTAYQRPVIPRSGNTTLANFLGAATGVVLESLELQMGNSLTMLDRINSTENVFIGDRTVTGSFTAEATTVATKDWFSLVANGTLSAIDLTHGTVTGNKVQLSAPNVQVLNPKFADQDGIAMLSGDLRFIPGASGSDDFKLTVL